MLKYLYDNLADIPEAYRSLFTQNADGKYVIAIEGMVPGTQLKEFRENNVKLMQERDTLKAKYEGVDPEEYKTLKTRKELLDDKKLLDESGVEAVVSKRVAKLQEDSAKAIKERDDKLTKVTEEMSRLKIDSAAVTVGAKLGLRPEAARDLTSRIREVFKMDADGNVVAMDGQGQKLYGTTGPLTIDEHIATLAKDKDHAHLFIPNSGSGGNGGQGGIVPPVNPWMPGATFNLTQQGRILRESPQIAEQLKAAAGVKKA